MHEKSRDFAGRVTLQSSKTASDPLYSGEHLKDVAAYLTSPLKRQPRAADYVPRTVKPFAHLYKLDAGLSKPQQFSSVANFEAEFENDQISHHAGLLFLTGHATPEWLNAVGGEFGIEPLHLLEHLSFRPTARFDTYAFPTLPSASTTVLKLSIPTIGHIEPHKSRLRGQNMQRLRGQCSELLRNQSRVSDSMTASGEAIVRRFHLLDPVTFVVEQDISISLVEIGERWTALIWCDSNGDGDYPNTPLRELPEYSGCEPLLTPVIQMNRFRHSAARDETTSPAPLGCSQTLALLPSNYGQMLDSQLAGKDALYSLYELMDFMASAEAQFLNLMTDMVNEHIAQASQDQEEAPLLSDFNYITELLEAHETRLKRLWTVLTNRERLNWPQASGEEQQIVVDECLSRLLDDFGELIDHVRRLLKRTERGKDIVMGNTNLLLAQQSFEYNLTLGKLTKIGTWVAILYVPLSFLTSIFGMNFKEFGQGILSIWIWAAASACVLLACFALLLYWQRTWVEKLMQRAWNRLRFW